MDAAADSKNWFQTLPGVLSGIAAVIAAVAGLMAAMGGADKSTAKPDKAAAPVLADACQAPYVWRLAVPSDHVCVTEDSRKQIELDNQRAAERRVASGGAYGPDTCQTGYVWREAFNGDTVCVLPERRAEIRKENALANKLVTR